MSEFGIRISMEVIGEKFAAICEDISGFPVTLSL